MKFILSVSGRNKKLEAQDFRIKLILTKQFYSIPVQENTYKYIQGVPKKVGINDLVWFDYDLVDSDCIIWS